MNRPTHFDILVDNPEKAIELYEKTFGWRFEKWEGPMEYWMIMTGEGEGIDGGMGLKRPDAFPMNTIEVEDIDKAIADVEKAGGKIMMPKMAIPTIGWFSGFTDPEGNSWGMMQEDPNAQ